MEARDARWGPNVTPALPGPPPPQRGPAPPQARPAARNVSASPPPVGFGAVPGAEAPIATDSDEITLVEGTTFCMSAGNGDIQPDKPHGLFHRDARVISRWQLRLDGDSPLLLSVAAGREAFTGRFISRRAPMPPVPDSTLLVVRDRLVSGALWETITLENLSGEATSVIVSLHVGADFADLFSVKEGRALGAASRAVPVVTPADLVLRHQGDGNRMVRVSATAEPLITAEALLWRIVIPARGRWATEVTAEPSAGPPTGRPGHHSRGELAPGDQRRAEEAARKVHPDLTVIRSEHPLLDRVLSYVGRDLGALRIRGTGHGKGPFYAAGAPWFMTLFGRDSLISASMALPLDPSVALGTLQALAVCQGRESDPVTEEQPGRILHELRRGPDRPGVGGGHYYGTVDASPLFVMTLAQTWRWGASPDAIADLLPAADRALEWIEQYGDRDGDGFVEYQRATDRGLVNQGWKDSDDGINYADGRIAHPPLALCEVQAYVYAAWLARAELAEGFGDPERAATCRDRAARLRECFLERFWLGDRGWYAVALDGDKRPVDALASNCGHCLWTGIATDEHAAVLIEKFRGEEMDSGYGLRTLGVSMGAYNPMSYHNGSVWPHDTAICVAGLLRYGHLPGARDLAERLAGGLLDGAAALGFRPPELYCGFPRSRFSPPVPYPTACSPQAWASAAPLLLITSFLGLRPDVPARTLRLTPRLPRRWGSVTVAGLQLGPAWITLTASGEHAEVAGLPEGWVCEL